MPRKQTNQPLTDPKQATTTKKTVPEDPQQHQHKDYPLRSRSSGQWVSYREILKGNSYLSRAPSNVHLPSGAKNDVSLCCSDDDDDVVVDNDAEAEVEEGVRAEVDDVKTTSSRMPRKKMNKKKKRAVKAKVSTEAKRKQKTKKNTRCREKNDEVNTDDQQRRGKNNNKNNSNKKTDASDDEDDTNRLWCICQQPWDMRFMISCDRCEDWFHGECVGLSEEDAKKLDVEHREFICTRCSEDVQSKTGSDIIKADAAGNMVCKSHTETSAKKSTASKKQASDICVEANSLKKNLLASSDQSDGKPQCRRSSFENSTVTASAIPPLKRRSLAGDSLPKKKTTSRSALKSVSDIEVTSTRADVTAPAGEFQTIAVVVDDMSATMTKTMNTTEKAAPKEAQLKAKTDSVETLGEKSGKPKSDQECSSAKLNMKTKLKELRDSKKQNKLSEGKIRRNVRQSLSRRILKRYTENGELCTANLRENIGKVIFSVESKMFRRCGATDEQYRKVYKTLLQNMDRNKSKNILTQMQERPELFLVAHGKTDDFEKLLSQRQLSMESTQTKVASGIPSSKVKVEKTDRNIADPTINKPIESKPQSYMSNIRKKNQEQKSKNDSDIQTHTIDKMEKPRYGLKPVNPSTESRSSVLSPHRYQPTMRDTFNYWTNTSSLSSPPPRSIHSSPCSVKSPSPPSILATKTDQNRGIANPSDNNNDMVTYNYRSSNEIKIHFKSDDNVTSPAVSQSLTLNIRQSESIEEVISAKVNDRSGERAKTNVNGVEVSMSKPNEDAALRGRSRGKDDRKTAVNREVRAPSSLRRDSTSSDEAGRGRQCLKHGVEAVNDRSAQSQKNGSCLTRDSACSKVPKSDPSWSFYQWHEPSKETMVGNGKNQGDDKPSQSDDKPIINLADADQEVLASVAKLECQIIHDEELDESVSKDDWLLDLHMPASDDSDGHGGGRRQNPVVWSGMMQFKEVPFFSCNGFSICGDFERVRKVFPTHISPSGKLSKEAVIDYVGKVCRSKLRDFIALYLLPSSSHEKMTYTALFRTLYSEERAVVIRVGKQPLRDVYLYPLLCNEPLPNFLVQKGTKGLSTDHPNLILTIMVVNVEVNHYESNASTEGQRDPNMTLVEKLLTKVRDPRLRSMLRDPRVNRAVNGGISEDLITCLRTLFVNMHPTSVYQMPRQGVIQTMVQTDRAGNQNTPAEYQRLRNTQMPTHSRYMMNSGNFVNQGLRNSVPGQNQCLYQQRTQQHPYQHPAQRQQSRQQAPQQHTQQPTATFQQSQPSTHEVDPNVLSEEDRVSIENTVATLVESIKSGTVSETISRLTMNCLHSLHSQAARDLLAARLAETLKRYTEQQEQRKEMEKTNREAQERSRNNERPGSQRHDTQRQSSEIIPGIQMDRNRVEMARTDNQQRKQDSGNPNQQNSAASSATADVDYRHSSAATPIIIIAQQPLNNDVNEKVAMDPLRQCEVTATDEHRSSRTIEVNRPAGTLFLQKVFPYESSEDTDHRVLR